MTARITSSTVRRRGLLSLSHAEWIFCLVRTDASAQKRQAGISFLLIDLATPGITVRPIKLIDGSVEVNEVFFDNVRVPAENLVGEENKGWGLRQVPARQRTHGGHTGRVLPKPLSPRQKRRRGRFASEKGTLLDDPLFAARLAELENDLLALDLTQLRVVASSADGKAESGIVAAQAPWLRIAAGGNGNC